MKAIIVAGGKGERLRPLTDHVPKPMLCVGGKPLLERTIDLLKKAGITDIIIALCYLPDVITKYFKDGSDFGVKITYTFEDPQMPLGTAGAILPAQPYILKLSAGQSSEPFIVTYADTLRELDIAEMIAAHENSKSIVTINAYKHRGTNFKSALVFNTNNELTGFREFKNSTELPKDLPNDFSWSNGSFYICSPEIFDYIQKNNKTDFSTDIFPKLISLGKKISVFPTSGYFIDIGTKQTLEQAEKDIQKGLFK